MRTQPIANHRPLSTLRHKQLYLLVAIPVIYVFVFSYIPMGGLVMAFQKYRISKGILGSEWVGMANFTKFFQSAYFERTIVNTLYLSMVGLVVGFPWPIALAICLNEVTNRFYRRAAQLITYAPYFISTVVMVAMLMQWFELTTGIVNHLIRLLGGEGIEFMGKARYFRSIYIGSNIWQFTGFNSIVYIAALNGIDPQLHEAAIVDGASRVRRVWHIDLPGILPTAIILLILSCGSMLNVGFEKVYLMQTPINLKVSTVISTYVYEIGLKKQDISFGTAIGFFNSTVNLIMIALVNGVARRLGETSLW